jgi:hypothetical protein
MAGHRLRLALEAVTPRPAADDDRDSSQRAADALDTIATRILSSADTKPGAHVPPHVSLILTEESLVGARAHLERRRAAAATGGVTAVANDESDDARERRTESPPPRHSYPPVTLEDGTPVPISEAAAALCDCAVTRVGIDADSVPMDLGRTQRLFTGEQRRAILARDRECIWPTCHMHARWLQIHHRIWWERDNGTTCLENGVGVCSFHHQEIHRLDLAIVPIPGSPDDGPPGGRKRRRSAISSVTYEFRDPAGRLVGEPEPARCGGSSPPEPLDLDRVTDPMTGMRVPAFFLSS